ncbi:MAG: T9SS type A sorting domain-containing protein [Saprospiraceae bacterium]|nr:T9SS type A sorting domain-containing protein [Saprospiraceae bacterium]
MKHLNLLSALVGLFILSLHPLSAQTNVHNYEIRFPKDAQANCTQPVPDTILVEEIGDCDLLAVSVQDNFFAASGDECYKIFRTYRVLNWCEYDGFSQPVVLSRDEDCDGLPGDEEVWVLMRPNGVTYFDRDNDQGNNIPAAFTKGTACDGLSNPAGHWVNSIIKPAIASRGYWQYTQHIKVYDNVKPVIAVAPYDPFCSYNNPPVCRGAVMLPFSVSELCTPDDVTIKVFLDEFNNGFFPFDYEVRLNPDGTQTGAVNVFTVTGAYPNYEINSVGQGLPIGTHKFEIHAEDGCGNVQSVQVVIEVRDCLAPTPICINGLTITLVPVDLDNDGIPDDGMMAIWATDMIAIDVTDCTPPIRYSLRRVGETPHIDRTGVTFTCADYNPADGPLGTWHIVYIDAWDGVGNRGYCETYVLVQDHSGICTSSGIYAEVSGAVYTEDDLPVESVSVAAIGYLLPMVTLTNDNGQYTLPYLIMNGDYTVAPIPGGHYTEGVTTLDLILIQRHILGLALLNSPYKLIAADANNSGTITLADIIQLRMLLLYMLEELPNVESARFIRADYVFPAPQNPWLETFPETVQYSAISQSHNNVDFICVKIGDVNNSAHSFFDDVEERNEAPAFLLHTREQALQPGALVEAAFTAKDLALIQGMQMTLGFDTDVLRLEDIEYGIMNEANFGTRRAEEGLVALSWHQTTPDAVWNEEEVLFKMIFRVQEAGMLSEALYMNSRLARAEAYDRADRIQNIALQFDGFVVTQPFQLHQNRPNPFQGQTEIGFYLPDAGEAVLTVTDLQGRILQLRKGHFDRGTHYIMVDGRDLPAGVLLYTLTSGAFTATRKMVVAGN